MNGFQLLLILFVAVPLVEIFVLIEVGAVIGAWPTVLLCIATAALGAALIRAQGLATLRKARESAAREEVPAVALLEGVFLLVAGLCLLTPGLVTDVIGFLCLVPPLRLALIEKAFIHRLSVRRPGPAPRGQIIEGEYREEKSD